MNGFEYRQVVMSEKDRVHTYAAWMLQDLEEARDVTQEALLRLWQRREPVQQPAARTWLVRTAHHLCLDRLRRRRNGSAVPLEALSTMLSTNGDGPECSAVQAELRVTMGRALASLSARDRAVLAMRDIGGMRYMEMSKVLDQPLGTMKVMVHRARARLRRQLLQAGVHP